MAREAEGEKACMVPLSRLKPLSLTKNREALFLNSNDPRAEAAKSSSIYAVII